MCWFRPLLQSQFSKQEDCMSLIDKLHKFVVLLLRNRCLCFLCHLRCPKQACYDWRYTVKYEHIFLVILFWYFVMLAKWKSKNSLEIQCKSKETEICTYNATTRNAMWQIARDAPKWCLLRLQIHIELTLNSIVQLSLTWITLILIVKFTINRLNKPL